MIDPETFLSETVTQLSTPVYATAFLTSAGLIYYLIAHKFEERRFKKKIHRLFGLIFSLLLALLLIGISTALGLL